MIKRYWSDGRVINFFIVCALLLVLYGHRYGLGMLNPLNDGWLMRHDWATNYLSWYFYRNEPWGFPLGKISNYFYPVGTNIGFTDIPLVDILFKVFSPILPEKFQFIGLLLLASHVLLGYYLLKLFELFHVRALVQLLATLLIVLNPVLIHRSFHPALCCHWLIVASLWIYFRDPKTNPPKKLLLYQCCLFLIGGLINPFFAVIEAGFLVALAWRLWQFDKQLSFSKAVFFVGASLLSLFICWYAIGYFEFNSQDDLAIYTGYGMYSFNLNSLYNSFGFSSIIGAFPIVSWHQYESFMYVGYGVIGLFFIMVLITLVNFYRKKINTRIFSISEDVANVSIFPLLLVVIALSLFAITNIITWNDKVLATIPIPSTLHRIGDVFRASARFFWVAYYFLLISFVLYVIRNSSRFWACLLMSVTLVVQIYDYKLLLADIGLRYDAYHTPLSENKWNFLYKACDKIVFFPPYQTTNQRDQDYQYFCYLAAVNRKPITMGYVARQDNKAISGYVDELSEQLDSCQFDDRTIYLSTVAYSGRFDKCFQGGKLNAINIDQYMVYYSEGLISMSVEDSIRKGSFALPPNLSERAYFRKFKLNQGDQAGNLLTGIDYLRSVNNQVVISGWVSLENKQNPSPDSIKIILRSKDNQLYAASAKPSIRNNLTMDSTGFYGSFFTDSLPKGSYEMAIRLSNGKESTYKFMNRVNIGFPERFEPRIFTEPIDSVAMQLGIDKLDDAGNFFKMEGWALLPDTIAAKRQISILLKAENGIIYVAPTNNTFRSDVTAYFKSKYNLDDCGFHTVVSKRMLPKGKYRIGIYIRDTNRDQGAAHFLDDFVEKL